MSFHPRPGASHSPGMDCLCGLSRLRGKTEVITNAIEGVEIAARQTPGVFRGVKRETSEVYREKKRDGFGAVPYLFWVWVALLKTSEVWVQGPHATGFLSLCRHPRNIDLTSRPFSSIIAPNIHAE